MKVEWLHHTGLNVSDMDQSLEFYRDLLGLEVTRDLVFEGEILDKLGGLPESKAHIVFWGNCYGFFKQPGGFFRVIRFQLRHAPVKSDLPIIG